MGHEALPVNLPLVLAFHQLELTNHAGAIDGGFNALVVVDEGPKHCGCLRFHFWVLVVLGEE